MLWLAATTYMHLVKERLKKSRSISKSICVLLNRSIDLVIFSDTWIKRGKSLAALIACQSVLRPHHSKDFHLIHIYMDDLFVCGCCPFYDFVSLF